MRFGVSVATVGEFADPRVQQRLAALAEKAGWDGYFVWDGVAHRYRPVLEPLVGLAAIATATERVLIGPLVSAVVFHPPRQLIASVATLARLSGGRLILGAGAGDAPESELAARGEAPLAARARELDARLAQLREGLAAEGVAVPIWVGAQDPLAHPGSMRRAGRYEGICPIAVDPSPETVAEIVRRVGGLRKPTGTPFDVAVFSRFATVRREEAEVLVTQYASAGATWLIESLLPWEHPGDAAVALLGRGVPR